ncbi:putative nitroreductase HBN1 [Colletotrichum sp. SAR11_59]|nr:putative nitroreductase HBN1 [Colletotrichum sp. SAR11_59]
MAALRPLRRMLQDTFCCPLPFGDSEVISTPPRYIAVDAPSSVSASDLLEVMQARRSHYQLSRKVPLSTTRIDEIVQEALAEVPSAFNSQSNRVIVLHGQQHDRLWDIITKILRAKVPDEKWEHTSEKMKNFKKAAGTVLFFEDQQIVEDLQEKYPSYATEVPLWTAQSDGMLQYAVWTLLAAEDIGANLQHYNPIIDEEVVKAWDVPKKWKLKGQLVFGGITGEPKPKDYMPMADRFRSYA